MSDEREGHPRPDETRQFSPFDDEDDATRVQGGSGWDHPDDGPRSGDSTRPMPAAGDDATAQAPPVRGPDATSVMPPVDEAAAVPSAWAGRAEVRPPQPGYDVEPEWAAEPPQAEPRGRWWMPILIGIVALILLALLGWGIWLIVQAQDRNNPASTPAVTTSIAPPPSTEPTTEQATTTPPTTEPTATAATVPAVRGLSRDQAQQALSRRGLSSRLRFVTTDQAPAGTVIDSDPEEGQEVPPDTVVTLIIAAEPTTEPTTTTDHPDEN